MKALTESLIEEGIFDAKQLEEAFSGYCPGSEPFHHFLIEHRRFNTQDLMARLCRHCQILELTEEKLTIASAPSTFQGELWVPFCLERNILPLSVRGAILDVAMVDPFDFEAVEELEECSKKIVNRYFCNPDLFALQKQIILSSLSVPASEEEEEVDPSQRQKLSEDAVSKVQEIFDEAIHQQASDIHMEPSEKEIHVRLRVDGLLQECMTLTKHSYSQVVCRIKILSNLDIAEKRRPQDGAIKYTHKGKSIEFRVSTLPGVHGENIVLRLLDSSNLLPQLKQIGFSGALLENYERLIQKPYGVILVTGPTGSGKTTTLYSTLSLLSKPETNLITIEDPVEYRREGIHQIQINTKAGMTFASALRSILRQDPDIIMVGEMRDQETAEIAIRAALTGHLVLSTLHTNDSPSSFARLIDMGVAPYLVTSSVLGILAQRLVRKVCVQCKVATAPSEGELAYLKYQLPKFGLSTDLSQFTFYKGTGCPKCNGRGYKGRLAIFELVSMDKEVSEAVLAGGEQEKIAEAAAKSQNYRSFWFDGWDKVLQGLTSLEELMRVAS